MLPLTLDLCRLSALVVGEGPCAARRLALLLDSGAPRITLFAPVPIPAILDLCARHPQVCLENRWPDSGDFHPGQIVLVADIEEPALEQLVMIARTAGTWINVEDRIPYCDFHIPSLLRRGDLIFSISTHGKSPTLARRLRACLERLFPPEWAERLETLAALRQQWRHEGLSLTAIAQRSNAWIDRQNWLP